jgi:tetratricopeptide (TPR) repeat protein
MPKARAAAMKALELDDSVAEAHAALGWVKWQYDWDWTGAEKEFQRSIELSPNYAIGHGMYALYLDSMSRVDEGMAQHKRARELEPLSLIINTNAGEALYDTRQYDQAIEQYRKTLEIAPSFAPVHDDLAEVFERKGMYREAVAEWQVSLIANGELRLATAMGQAYTKSGYEGALHTWLDDITNPAIHTYACPLLVASTYARLGEVDRAFEWLAKAYQERASDLVFLRVQPAFDNLRSDPRYAELERTIGFPQ